MDNFTENLRRKLKKFSRNYVPEEDLTAPPPERGLPRFWFLLGSHYPKLMLLSLLFSLTALPAVTFPAACSGMFHVAMELVRKGNSVDWFKSYWEGFRDRFLDRLLLGTGCLSSSCLASLILLYLGAGKRIAYGVGIAVFLICNSAWQFFLVMQDSIDLTFFQNVKNAWILMMLRPKETGILIGLSIAEGAILWFLYPYWVPVMTFFGFAAISVFVANLLWPVVKDKIAAPKETEQPE